MEPTLSNLNLVLVNRFDRNFEVDEIVLLNRNGSSYIKRIVAVSGQSVVFNEESSLFWIDNERYFESCFDCFHGLNELFSNEVEVPESSFFVIGDNFDNSIDSRVWGFITEDEIVGRIRIKLWPFGILD